jgi:hypothetical protein
MRDLSASLGGFDDDKAPVLKITSSRRPHTGIYDFGNSIIRNGIGFQPV